MKSPQANMRKAIRELPELRRILRTAINSYDEWDNDSLNYEKGKGCELDVEDCRHQVYLIARLLDEILGEEV